MCCPVLGRGQHIEMIGIDATPIEALVMNLHVVGRESTTDEVKNQSVDVQLLAVDVILAVPGGGLAAEPLPAFTIAVNEVPERRAIGGSRNELGVTMTPHAGEVNLAETASVDRETAVGHGTPGALVAIPAARPNGKRVARLVPAEIMRPAPAPGLHRALAVSHGADLLLGAWRKSARL